MCLGIPGQVVELVDGFEGQLALVDVVGAQRRVNIGMLDGDRVGPGDWILIHMGFAMERVDEAEARQALAGLEMLGQPQEHAEMPRA
jgi:hydrogenase expression/formation protein HypC